MNTVRKNRFVSLWLGVALALCYLSPQPKRAGDGEGNHCLHVGGGPPSSTSIFVLATGETTMTPVS